MKNPYTIIAFLALVFLTLIPPIDFFIKNPFMDKWFLLILICGFAGFFTIFVKTNWIVRTFAIGSFVQCFTSVAPFISFTSYISIILCCYFYIACTRIENWDLIFKCLQAVLFLNLFMMFAQSIGRDTLLNWGATELEHFGVIGQHMQMASFAAIICAILISFHPANLIFPLLIALFCNSIWGILVSGVGFSIFLMHFDKKLAFGFMAFCLIVFLAFGIKQDKFNTNFHETGRFPIWAKSVQAANEHPFVGWGAGTYKFIFPQISTKIYANMWYKNSHNFITQLLFEVGYITTAFILICLGLLAYHIFMAKKYLLLSGFSIIIVDALVHFPERMIQCVPLIILFLAYCEVKLWIRPKINCESLI